MAELLVGPMLRHVGERDATVWVETDGPCEVEVCGVSEPTFAVNGHHFALVCIADLEPGTSRHYEVRLDGEVRWPEPGSDLPPSCIRTLEPGTPLRISFPLPLTMMFMNGR